MVSTSRQGLLLAMAAVMGIDAASVSVVTRQVAGLALLDTLNNVCLSDYAADHQLFSAMGNAPVTFDLSNGQLTLLGQSDNAVCDVTQGSQFECNMPSGYGSYFSITSDRVLVYSNQTSNFYGCTNTHPPVGAPSTNYFTHVADYSPNCRITTLKFIPKEQCPSVIDRAIKDLTTGICLSSYSAAHYIYAEKGSPIDKFSLTGSELILNAGDWWKPRCVTSQAGGYAKQLACTNDIDYDNKGQVIPSSYAYSASNKNGNLVLSYANTDGTFSSSFYGCGPNSAVYFAVAANPEASPGICHFAELAFVDASQCATTAVAAAVSEAALEQIADATIAKADELNLNEASATSA